MKTSAGLLMYKFMDKKLVVFLVHPGGPFFQDKDKGFWGIPKGEQDDPTHDLFDVAKREFFEETGIIINSDVKFIPLGSIKQDNSKIVHAWAFENNEDINFNCMSCVRRLINYELIEFCEVDKGEFFKIENVKEKILASQWEFIERLIRLLEYKENITEELKLGV